MAKVEKKEVYTLSEVLEKFGIYEHYKNKTDAELITIRDIKKGEFPLPAIQIKNRWYFPKRPVDDFLNGMKPQNVVPPWLKVKRGRPRKFIPGEYVNYNYRIPLDLDKKFNMVIKNINEKIPNPMPKGDFLRLAIEEFIDRRPEYQDKEENEDTKD